MFDFRYYIALGLGTISVLNFGVEASARELGSVQNLAKNLKNARANDNLVHYNENVKKSLLIAESPTTTPKPKPIDNPETIEESPNRLLYPTKPEEVETTESPITLQQAIDLALKNNKEIQNARTTLQRSQAELDEANATLYPQLSTQTELRNEGDDSINNQTRITNTLELSYNLYSGDRNSATRKQANQIVRLRELDIERVTEQTRFEVTQNYYELQNADAQVEIELAAIQDAQRTLRDAQLLEKAGLGTKFDVLRAEVELANATQRFNTAKAAQVNARRTLAETIGVSQTADLVASDEIKEAGIWELSLENSIVLAYKNRVELEQALLQRDINEQQKIAAQSDTKPQVDIFANYNTNDTFGDDQGIADNYTFGARMSWTIFDGGASSARGEQEEIDKQTEEIRFAQQRNEIRLQVEQAYNNLIANKDNIGTSQKAQELAEESLILARLRFQAGVGTQTDVIEAQSDLTTARGNYLRAIINYNQSLNELQRAVSNLPDNNLFDLP
jgi:outer membrane factor, OMF family